MQLSCIYKIGRSDSRVLSAGERQPLARTCGFFSRNSCFAHCTFRVNVVSCLRSICGLSR